MPPPPNKNSFFNHLATSVAAAFNSEQAIFTFKDITEPSEKTATIRQAKEQDAGG